MANARLGNKIYVDAAGELTTARTLVTGILFTPAAADDSMVLAEVSGGSTALKIQSPTAKLTQPFDFSTKPMVFNNGIYVVSITAGAVATIITSEAGG